MESWRKVWRVGFAPNLPLGGLVALRTALRTDDPKLLQGATTSPPPMPSVQDWPCDAADAIGYCGWKDDGLGLKTVGEVEEFFASHCFEADQKLLEPAACRYFVMWFDDTPRDQMRLALLPEVEAEITLRGSEAMPLVKAIRAHPSDGPRSVFADWCEENGREKDAELLRAALGS